MTEFLVLMTCLATILGLAFAWDLIRSGRVNFSVKISRSKIVSWSLKIVSLQEATEQTREDSFSQKKEP